MLRKRRCETQRILHRPAGIIVAVATVFSWSPLALQFLVIWQRNKTRG